MSEVNKEAKWSDILPGTKDLTMQQVKEIMEKNFPESALAQYLYEVHMFQAQASLTKRQITHLQSQCKCKECGKFFDTCSRCTNKHTGWLID